MKLFNTEHIRRLLWGTKEHPVSLRKQLTRLILICCTAVALLQSGIMVSMLFHQYIVQEKENTLYLLDHTHKNMNSGFQYVEDLVLNLQDQPALQDFFRENNSGSQPAADYLKSSAFLFSEKNEINTYRPFIENIYLFNSSGDVIYDLYYPATLTQIEAELDKYVQLNNSFSINGRNFYLEVEDLCIHLCLWLYDNSMQPLGTCIFTLNKDSILSNYEAVENYKFYCWNITAGDQVIAGNKQLPVKEPLSFLERTQSGSFGLTLYSGIPVRVVYSTLASTMGMILLISLALILLLSLLVRTLAVSYVEPLETVAEKIQLVGKGNFDTKLSEYSIEELQNISSTFNDMTDYINHLIKEVYETQLMAQHTQIQYLQAQIQPHFLSNTLAMIQMQAALNNDREVQEMLLKLSRLYQGKIFRKDEHFITLKEEMEIIDFYLSLQTSRFRDKLTYSISYEGDAASYEHLLVPRLSIEPLVENAVCHGLIPKADSGSIKIYVSGLTHLLKITVTDDGVGFSADSIPENKDDTNHTHVGLWNTNKMIRNLCGDQFGLTIESKVGQGTTVVVHLPIKTEELYVESNDC